MEPVTWVCALTRNQTCNLSVTGQRSNHLSHTVQSSPFLLIGRLHFIKHIAFQDQTPFYTVRIPIQNKVSDV